MLLTIDIGNTNIVFGLFEGSCLKRTYRIETSLTKSSDEYGAMVRQLFRLDGYTTDLVEHVIISSVVPSINYTIQHFCEKFFEVTPLFVSNDINTGIVIDYENPKSLGADRIVNAAAAAVLYPGPCILIDYGTATTFCALDANKHYLGGVIMPGVKISSDALFERTSKLPKIEITTPQHVIGKNTVECMESGVLLGHVGATEYLINHMKEEMESDAKVIATGGLSGIIAENTKSIDVVDKLLTLKGLQILWELNS